MPNSRERIAESDFMCLKQCRHGLFLYNLNDTFVGRSLDLYGEWCEPELHTLGQVIRAGDVVLDVGANIGTHTVYFARAVGETGAVYALEPQRLLFQTLCANLALNAIQNVRAFQVGLGRAKARIRLKTADPRSAINHAAIPMHEEPEGEFVDVLSIDELELQRCNLIKIDVEGMELDVLAGAKETIRRHRPILFVENNTVIRSTQTIAALLEMDYDLYWHISSYYNNQNYFGNTTNIFGAYQPEANLLCFPRSMQVQVVGTQRVQGIDDNWKMAVERGVHES